MTTQQQSSVRRPRLAVIAALGLLIASASAPAADPGRLEPLDAVDVFTGTSNSRWQLFPGAAVPFGLVKLSPDNQANVWNGGYEYTIDSISGFSHLHAMTLSGLSLMPTVGPIEPHPGQAKVFPGPADGPFGTMWTAGYRSRYRKEDEKGGVGFYGVHLLDYDVEVELTATLRTGLLRLTWPESEEARILVDLDPPTEERTEVREVFVRRTGPAEIEGWARQGNQYTSDFTVHFVVRLSRSFDSMDAWEQRAYEGEDLNYGTAWRAGAEYRRDVTEHRGGPGSGVVLNLATTEGEQTLVRTGLSLVDVAGARANLDAEQKGAPTFDDVVAAARAAWSPILDRVQVEGGPDWARAAFYTNLYRAYSGKSVVNDVDGRYRDACERVRALRPPANAVYSSDGFWGTQWTISPVWTLLTPDLALSWVHALLELADAGGWIPTAPVDLEYAPIMTAQHQQSLIVSAWQKGLRGFDAEKAWAAIEHDLTTPGVQHECGGFAGNRHLAAYVEHGYVPEEAGPVSNTLEYAYDDWAASQLAFALGKREAAKRFRKRSESWRNVFDAETGYVRRKHADGRWMEPFDRFAFGTEGSWNGPGFVEATSWIFTFFVPQNVPGLVETMGREEFNRRLEEGFAKGYVDLGNQPNLQAPFLFNYSGKPWLTQKYSRHVLETMFDTSPLRGWVGEEDEGQMGALFVLLSMGLFEMDGGTSVDPFYDIGSPLFDRVVIDLDLKHYGGRTFTIEARDNSPENVYVQAAELNGARLSVARLRHADLVKGGTLVLQMGPEPNREWGVAP